MKAEIRINLKTKQIPSQKRGLGQILPHCCRKEPTVLSECRSVASRTVNTTNSVVSATLLQQPEQTTTVCFSQSKLHQQDTLTDKNANIEKHILTAYIHNSSRTDLNNKKSITQLLPERMRCPPQDKREQLHKIGCFKQLQGRTGNNVQSIC